MSEIYNLRLEETKKHGDLKMSFKAFVEANQTNDKSKKKVEIPRTLGEITSYLTATMFKHPGIADALGKSLSLIFKQNVVHF